MVAASVRRDARLVLGSAELRLVYPQIFRRAIPGPDHAGEVVARCELLGRDPLAVATRVIAEARQLGLLVESATGELVSAHMPKPRTKLPDDEAARLELRAAKTYLKRRRTEGDTRPDSVVLAEHAQGYQTRRKTGAPPLPPSTCDAPCVADPPGVVSQHSDTEAPSPRLSSKKEEEEISGSSSSSFPEKSPEALSGTAREAPPSPPPPCVANAVTHAHDTDPPPPPSGSEPMASALGWPKVRSILSGASHGVFGVACLAPTQQQFIALLDELLVTTSELKELAKRAGSKQLKLFDKKLGTPEQKTVDLHLLVSPNVVWHVASWVNEIRSSASAQPELGLPANAQHTGAAARASPPPPTAAAPPVRAGQLSAGLAFGRGRSA